MRVVQGVRGWHYCCEARITCKACTAVKRKLWTAWPVTIVLYFCHNSTSSSTARETRVTLELYDLITENLINTERLAGQLKKWRKHEYCKRLAASLHHAVRCGVGDEGSESQGTGQLLGNRGQQQLNLGGSVGARVKARPLHPPPPSISAKRIRSFFIDRQQKVQLFQDMLRGNLSLCDLLGTDSNRKVRSACPPLLAKASLSFSALPCPLPLSPPLRCPRLWSVFQPASTNTPACLSLPLSLSLSLSLLQTQVFSRVCFGPGNKIPLRDMVTFMSEYSIPICTLVAQGDSLKRPETMMAIADMHAAWDEMGFNGPRFCTVTRQLLSNAYFC